jgi:hypothetical protein
MESWSGKAKYSTIVKILPAEEDVPTRKIVGIIPLLTVVIAFVLNIQMILYQAQLKQQFPVFSILMFRTLPFQEN